MEIISVVSRTSKSGKTTVVEKLVEVLKKRGYSVATIKHIPKEKFTIDREGSDTWIHAKAGAELVVGLSNHEAAFLLKKEKSLEEVIELIENFGKYDFLIIEGFRKEKFPKIIAAKSLEDVEELRDELTLAVSGVVASQNPELDLPVVDVLREPEKLADILESPELRIKSVLRKLPMLNCGECGLNCTEMARKIAEGEKTFEDCVVIKAGRDVVIEISGRDVPLGSFVQGFVRNIVMGMVTSLKKVELKEGDEIVVKVRVAGKGGGTSPLPLQGV